MVNDVVVYIERRGLELTFCLLVVGSDNLVAVVMLSVGGRHSRGYLYYAYDSCIFIY